MFSLHCDWPWKQNITVGSVEVTQSEKKILTRKKGFSTFTVLCVEAVSFKDLSGRLNTQMREIWYQGEAADGEQHFEAAVDEEGAEHPEAVVPQVFERQLEDVSPADAAQVDLLRRPVGGAAQHQELRVKGFPSGQYSGWWKSKGGAECLVVLRSYNDHGEEGKAHEDALHFDEQHGARQLLQHGGVEAWDHAGDVCSCRTQASRWGLNTLFAL